VSLGLLALVVAGLVAAARSGLGLAENVRGSAIAGAAADGSVQEAMFQLGCGAWQPNEPTHRVAIGQAIVEVHIEDQSERINPNLSPPALLASLLGAVGVEPGQAGNLSRLMVDWRTASTISLVGGLKLDRYRFAGVPYGPPNRPFRSVEEMGQLPGVTADLLDRLRPYLSVYQTGQARETATNRDLLRDAAVFAHGATSIGSTSSDKVVLVSATAMLGDGTRFVRRAVVRIAAHAKPGEIPWQILSWK